MNEPFQQFHCWLGRWTKIAFVVCLVCLSVAVGFALLGFPHVVSSFRAASWTTAVVGGVGFALFVVTTLVTSMTRWLDSRSENWNAATHSQSVDVALRTPPHRQGFRSNVGIAKQRVKGVPKKPAKKKGSQRW
jgi:hypothetical protein